MDKDPIRGKRFADARLAASGITQEDLAAELRKRVGGKTSKSTVSRWETGDTVPRGKTLKALCGLLSTTEAWLVFGAGAPPVPGTAPDAVREASEPAYRPVPRGGGPLLALVKRYQAGPDAMTEAEIEELEPVAAGMAGLSGDEDVLEALDDKLWGIRRRLGRLPSSVQERLDRAEREAREAHAALRVQDTRQGIKPLRKPPQKPGPGARR